jgi:hypothetical protein
MAIAQVKYSLNDFNNITFNGFNYTLPNEVLKIINELTCEVGSPTYVKTPIFQKRENLLTNVPVDNFTMRKRKNNKSKEVISDMDWDNLKNFQPTKLEEKVGIDSQIDTIRMYLNKITEQNYIDMCNNITKIIDELILTNINKEQLLKLGNTIFEIASTNRFHSKTYADLYTDLINKYEVMGEVFDINYNNFLQLFDIIEYVDPTVDYDKFCKINQQNEKRKSLATFFINLMNNKIITKQSIALITRNLLNQVYTFIQMDNKKKEVDELVENIVLLYKREIYGKTQYDLIDGLTIPELVEKLAHSKSKTYLSLTNKSIFKFMDLIEM